MDFIWGMIVGVIAGIATGIAISNRDKLADQLRQTTDNLNDKQSKLDRIKEIIEEDE